MLAHRLTLGPVLLLAVIALFWLDQWLETAIGIPGLIVLPLLLLVAAGAAVELNRLFTAAGIRTTAPAVVAAATLGLLISGFTREEAAGVSGVALVGTVGIGVLLGAMLYYSRSRELRGLTAASSATLLAFVYPGVLCGFFYVVRREFEPGGWLILAILLIVKASDIGAFFVGRSLGRHKLIPWVSPGKTWEGLAGGVLTSAAVAMALSTLWTPAGGHFGHPLLLAAGIGALFGLVGQGGDLVASMLKRDAGVKDASSLLPGFGGVLDVIDSPLLVAPLAYWIFAALELLADAAPSPG
ncbi:MAG: phosphatidate cytidylyltransferase [Planctomycetota bacterium]